MSDQALSQETRRRQLRAGRHGALSGGNVNRRTDVSAALPRRGLGGFRRAAAGVVAPRPRRPCTAVVERQAQCWRVATARRRWAEAGARWAAANGWTPQQLLGLRHPSWITYGWADRPPHAGATS